MSSLTAVALLQIIRNPTIKRKEVEKKYVLGNQSYIFYLRVILTYFGTHISSACSDIAALNALLGFIDLFIAS